jgi:hypothetical protein
VTIVLSELSGAAIAMIAALGPIWLRTSPGNRRVAENLCSLPDQPAGQVTIFDPPPGSSAEEASLYILDTVVQHHPAWTSMEFIGADVSAAHLRELACYAEGSVQVTKSGFVFSKRLI